VCSKLDSINAVKLSHALCLV